MLPTTFIYALCEPNSRTVRYIGKANNPDQRFKEHLRGSSKKKNHLGCWLSSVLSAGETPAIVVLREVPDENWKIAEERYIRLARGLGMELVNGTDGGDGCHNPTPEVRAKISASRLGKKLSAEHRAKVSASLTGTKHSVESRANMSAAQKVAQKGKKRSAEWCAKQRAAQTGLKRSAEWCAKNSALRLGKKHSAECRANMSAARFSYHQFRRMPWFTDGEGI